MKYLLFLIIPLFSCKANRSLPVSEAVMFIEFQDFFREDTVGVRVGNCLIFDQKILTSQRGLGFTGIVIKAFRSEKDLILEHNGRRITCLINLRKVPISVTVNETVRKYEVNVVDSGKYIGISRRESELVMIQSKKPFAYD